KTIIASFGNSCDLKRIKAELTPALLTAGEWTSWNGKAREILKINPDFGVSPDNIDIFTVRDRPISVTEKLYNSFNAERNFFDKAAVIRDFVNNKETDPDSENFSEMLSYLTGFLRTTGQAAEQTAAFLLIKELSANENYSHLASSLTVNFSDIFADIRDVPSLFMNLKDSKLKENFLINVKQFIQQWPDIYVKLFPFALMPSIVAHLERENYTEKLVAMCNDCFENFRDNREAVIWLFKNSTETPWYKAANLSYEKQLITLIHILDLSYRDIKNHKDAAENRKINKLVYNILFKDGCLAAFLDKSDEDTIIRLYTFVNAIKDLDPQDKLNLRSRILDNHPSFKFFGDTEKRVSRGLIVTQVMYEEKKKQLAHIMDEEVPANSKEIEYALSLGDLRENAEYKAAKEKQEQLNSQAARLKEDIERAQLFDPNSVNTSRVSFGTKVVLRNESMDTKEAYTILGPWESNPENKIISYLSPFGGVILNKTVGEKFEFVINNERISYEVEQISAAEI
ncbi:MAG: transcription elongation factor GreA, partial [Treponema sp.]|nr:transcription elongation factor GreA [Treponema sp.]